MTISFFNIYYSFIVYNNITNHFFFLTILFLFLQITFGSIFLGKVPVHEEVNRCAGQIYGFKGCIRDFQVNHKELFIIDEALEGRNIENCNVPICDYHPCHNGGICTR